MRRGSRYIAAIYMGVGVFLREKKNRGGQRTGDRLPPAAIGPLV